MCFSALSEKGCVLLWFDPSAEMSLCASVLLSCGSCRVSENKYKPRYCQPVVRLNDHLLAHTLLSKETPS